MTGVARPARHLPLDRAAHRYHRVDSPGLPRGHDRYQGRPDQTSQGGAGARGELDVITAGVQAFDHVAPLAIAEAIPEIVWLGHVLGEDADVAARGGGGPRGDPSRDGPADG